MSDRVGERSPYMADPNGLFEALCSALGRGTGAQGRNRTTDTVIFSHVLYQLSYLGIRPGRDGYAPPQAAASGTARGL